MTPEFPNEQIAADTLSAMTNEIPLSCQRLTTGDQYFVFGIKTSQSDYVLRMTDTVHKHRFVSALYWQTKLLPLGVPLARFIQSDIDGKLSGFPALLMLRIPGDDLINVYSTLNRQQKMQLANEIVMIQAMSDALPNGNGFGFADNYEQILGYHSWYDFLMERLHISITSINQASVFNHQITEQALSIAKEMKNDLAEVTPRPFLWDTSERNVIVHNGHISGIVDVDELCFGDPLFVLALTYTALELYGHDTLYPDYWAHQLNLDAKANLRLEFYRLLYTLWFMRKHAQTSVNQQKIILNAARLEALFQQSLQRLQQQRSTLLR